MKVLIYSEAWGKGGIETFICNEISGLQGKGFDFSVFTTWCWENLATFVSDAYGVDQNVVFNGYKPGLVKRTIEGAKAFGHLLSQGEYDAVHINTMNGAGFVYSWVAKKHGVSVRVVHSHNSDVGEGARALKRVLGKAFALAFGRTPTVRIACSGEAGRYLFGDKPFKVVNNGIDTERFRFNLESRAKVRAELGIADDEVLIGNIGRLAPAKNPRFQLEVFDEFLKLQPKARYLMLGGGELKNDVLTWAEELGVSDKLIIHDPVSDTAPWYCALDAFLMPSYFEGLGIVRLEAQDSGLPILVSDSLPVEGNITELSVVKSLDMSAADWARELFELCEVVFPPRGTFAFKVKRAGFDKEDSIQSFSEHILGGCEVLG